jgi:hypothetical protein
MTDLMTEDLAPLKVSCTRSDCEHDLHCYLATAKMVKEDTAGRCRACGISLIDWDRVRSRNYSDVAFTFECMRTEFIRHHFWHIEIDDDAIDHVKEKGMLAIFENVPKRLLQSIGKAQPFRDGTQTPFEGKAVYYAQHATATCCRKCVEEWHGIRRGRALEDEEIQYLSQLVIRYLEERLKDIPHEGTKPTRKRREKNPVLAEEV